MTIQSCAGGWCAKRDHCANYHAASVNQTPSQRLCPPGMDGADMDRHHETVVQFRGFDFTLPRERQAR